MTSAATRSLRSVFALMACAALLATAVPTNAAPPAQTATKPDDERRDLQELRLATARFHDADLAIAAGWAEQPVCLDYPDGFYGEPPGAMGNHFYNLGYLQDGGKVDPSEPELLLYERRADGRWRLNAVEYIVSAHDLPGTAEPPMLFGQQFRFYPDIGAAGIWGLHVWVWRHNPRGMYVNLNPRVTCANSPTQSTV